jgi:hypothetical protein
MKNNNKYKFPVDIKGDLELPDFDISENFSVKVVKNKIDVVVNEIQKNNKKKCQSSSLM